MNYAIDVLENDKKIILGALSLGSWKGYEAKKIILQKRILELDKAIEQLNKNK